MSKYILIPDSFKGSLSSGEICGILGREIRTLEPEAEICSIPVADGGEGTVDAFLAALGGEKSLFPAGIPMAGPSPPATAFCRTAALP